MKVSENPCQSKKGSANDSRSRRILIVEDEATLRMGFEFALSTEGYRVESASDGDEALACLERLQGAGNDAFDAMLLDLRMPGKSGIEVVREMDTREDLFVPTVIASAYIDSPTAVRAVDLGVVDFLRKPMTPDDVRGVVAKILEEEDERDRLAARPELTLEQAVAHARCCFRRRDVEGAAQSLESAPDSDQDADAPFWKLLSEHLRICRESGGGKETKFASSRFYQAADLLDFLAFNR